MTKRLPNPTTPQERGTKGGLASARVRHRQAQQKARDAALAALEANAAGLHIASQLATWVRSGVLDAWIVGIHQAGYRAGIGARWVQRQRRERPSAPASSADQAA